MSYRRLALTARINTYAAMLLLTLLASAAALAIVRVGTTHYAEADLREDERQYAELKEAILQGP